jgi:hypothetical protein
MQGKGGVGKSFVASILFQYLKKKGLEVFGCDTDPVNNTFAGYKEFNITTVDIMSGNDIDNARFDVLMELISELPEQAHLVVDNGASSFVTFCAYIKENEAFDVLKEAGHEVFIHVLITGGQAMPETLTGLSSLLKHFEGYPPVVWLNPKDGPIRMNDRDFYDFGVYQENQNNLRAVIEMPAYTPNTYGRDLADLLSRRLSFEAGINSSTFHIMNRSRLYRIWRDLERAIDQANLV